MPRDKNIKVRRNTAANAASSNPILDAGEVGYETDTKRLKVGDGATAWNSLAEVGSGTYVRGRDVSIPVRNFMRKLRLGVTPAAILVQGDSTGNDAAEWVYLTAQWLAGNHPAFTVRHRVWSDANQSYDRPTTLQVGLAGERRWTDPGNGSASNKIFTIADSALTSPVGDMVVDVRVNLRGGGFATRGTLCSKYAVAPQIAWRVAVNTDDTMLLTWSADGTNVINATSTVALSGSELNSDIWLRATIDVDNGATGNDVRFYTSSDYVTWTQLGATITTAGVTSIKDSTAAVQLNGNLLTPIAAVGHAVDFLGLRIYGSLDATAPVVDIDMGDFSATIGAFNDCRGNPVTTSGSLGSVSGAPNLQVFNASTPGATISYSYSATRSAKQLVGSPDLGFISYGHNEGATTWTYRDEYKTLIDLNLARFADLGIVCVTQNPKIAPASNRNEHAFRFERVLALAATQRYATVDVYGEMIRSDPTAATYTSASDGIHLTEAGDQFWAGLVQAMLTVAM